MTRRHLALLLAFTLSACSSPPTESDAGAWLDAGPPGESDAAVNVEPDASSDAGPPDAAEPGRWTWTVTTDDVRLNSDDALVLDAMRFRCGWEGPGSPLPFADGDRLEVEVEFLLNGAARSLGAWERAEEQCGSGDHPNWTLVANMFECGDSVAIAFDAARVRGGERDLERRAVVSLDTAAACVP